MKPLLANVSRRQLLQVGAVGLTGIGIPELLRAAPVKTARARSCILLYMDGGPSHIDLFDLKPQAPAEIRGPWQPIDSSVPGISVGELLPLVAREMHRVALVRSVRHEETVHDPAVYQMLTGYKHVSSAGGLKVEETDLPHAGAAFGRADASPAVMPKVIQLPELMNMESRVLPGQNGGILGAAYDPFLVDVTPQGEVHVPPFALQADLSAWRLRQRAALLDRLDREHSAIEPTERTGRLDKFQRQAIEILAAPQIDRAFELDREPAIVRDRFGRNRHGQSVLLARRLIEAGARFVTVYWGREPQDWADGRGARPANNPWDTHRNHFPLVKDSLVPRADRAFSALLEDLSQRGLLEETLVVWMGDFGRTPRISRPWASRDHWPHAFSVMLAGGGIRGGAIHGKTDDQAAFVTDAPVSPADLTATMFELLGIPAATVIRDAAGRPHRLSRGVMPPIV